MNRLLLLLALGAGSVLAGCASGAPSAAASDAEWSALARPRPAPLDGAPRIALGAFELGEERWGLAGPVPAPVVLQELVGAGLLRRPDVSFVERRRFVEAAERERRGLPRAPGSPPVGVSDGPELLLTATLTPPLGDSAWLSLRLADPETGTFRSAWRFGIPAEADPAAVARRVTGTLLSAIDSLGSLPSWDDPLAAAAPLDWRRTGVAPGALDAFARGIAAEDAYDWEGARRAYQRAVSLSGGRLFEAEVALARVARLRGGGTLGAG